MVSVGGWTGSLFYSSNVGSAENRTAFVKTVTDLATKYNLDGIDFDWEYPGSQGIGCNVVTPQDTTNFLEFLQELRQDPVGKNLILTAATSIFPWKDASGAQLKDVSGFAKTLDWIAIMNYDVWGSWYVEPDFSLTYLSISGGLSVGLLPLVLTLLLTTPALPPPISKEAL